MGKRFRGCSGFLALFFLFYSFSLQAQTCAQLFDTSSLRSLKENSQLKIANWNLLNLRMEDQEIWEKEHRERLPSDIGNKKPIDLKNMKAVFEDLDADIYIFEEVFGLESLQNLIRKEMNNGYEAYLIAGNDGRGIQVGFAIRRSLNVDVQMETNRDLKWVDENGHEKPAFVRDLPILYLREKDGTQTKPKEAPDLIVLGTHYISKRTSEPNDVDANKYRTEHAQRTAQIISDLQSKYPKVPIILGGDFNTDVTSAPELKPLRETLDDSLALMGDQLTRDDKVTHTFHPLIHEKGQKPVEAPVVAAQLDGLFVNQSMAQRFLSAFVYHFKDIMGQVKKYSSKLYPQSFKERKKNPSDHMPIVAIYDMTRS